MKTKAVVVAEIPIWIQLNKVSKKYMDALANRLSHIGIRRHFFLLLAIADKQGRITQQELADLLEMDKVAMVGILDALSQAGLVKRQASTEDRRKHWLVLTPKGEKHIPEIRKAVTDLNRQAFSVLSKSFAEQLPGALARMKSELDSLVSA